MHRCLKVVSTDEESVACLFVRDESRYMIGKLGSLEPGTESLHIQTQQYSNTSLERLYSMAFFIVRMCIYLDRDSVFIDQEFPEVPMDVRWQTNIPKMGAPHDTCRPQCAQVDGENRCARHSQAP